MIVHNDTRPWTTPMRAILDYESDGDPGTQSRWDFVLYCNVLVEIGDMHLADATRVVRNMSDHLSLGA